MDHSTVPVTEQLNIDTNISYDFSKVPEWANLDHVRVLRLHTENCSCEDENNIDLVNSDEDLFNVIESALELSEEFGMDISSTCSQHQDNVDSAVSGNSCPFGSSCECPCLEDILEDMEIPDGNVDILFSGDSPSFNSHHQEQQRNLSEEASSQQATPPRSSLSPEMTSTPTRFAYQRDITKPVVLHELFSPEKSSSSESDECGGEDLLVFSDLWESDLCTNTSIESLWIPPHRRIEQNSRTEFIDFDILSKPGHLPTIPALPDCTSPTMGTLLNL